MKKRIIIGILSIIVISLFIFNVFLLFSSKGLLADLIFALFGLFVGSLLWLSPLIAFIAIAFIAIQKTLVQKVNYYLSMVMFLIFLNSVWILFNVFRRPWGEVPGGTGPSILTGFVALFGIIGIIGSLIFFLLLRFKSQKALKEIKEEKLNK